MTWGVEENVVERFTAAGVPEEAISFERDTYTFTSPVRRQSWLPLSGPTTGRP